jgi:hypothetical protein
MPPKILALTDDYSDTALNTIATVKIYDAGKGALELYINDDWAAVCLTEGTRILRVVCQENYQDRHASISAVFEHYLKGDYERSETNG